MKRVREPVGERGFSIIELMVTLFVLGTVLTSVLSMFAQVDYITDRARELLLAHTSAFEKLQTYENKSFTSIIPGSSGSSYQVEDFSASLPSNLTGPKTARVYVKSISPTLKRVDVQVAYQDRRVQRILNYTTMVQESGLGR